MTGHRKTWALAILGGALTTALVGGVAFATFQPPSADLASAVPAGLNGTADQTPPKDRIKAALDALVKKGTITQAQEDAILQALQQSAPPRPKPPVGPLVPNIKFFIGDLMRTTTTYLGLSPKDLGAQLRAGRSIAEITAAQGKSTTELAALLTKNANDRIDQAVTAKKLTPEQAATLKAKVAEEVSSFLKRSFTPGQRPVLPPKPPLSPKP